MKKLFIILMFLSTSLFAQDWERSREFEEELYNWDIHLGVWALEDEDITINFEDEWSDNWYDVREQMAGLFYVLVDMEIDFMDYIIYSWVDGDISWDMHMDREWLNYYFLASRADKRKMLDLIIQTQQLQWEIKNNLYLRPQIDESELRAIEQQQKLEKIAPNLPPSK